MLGCRVYVCGFGKLLAPGSDYRTFVTQSFVLKDIGIRCMDRLRGYTALNVFSVKRMIKMVRFFTKFLLTLIVILFANQSFAEKMPTLTPKDLGEPRSFLLTDILKTQVEIRDYLQNGCWTNLGEVKAYAEDKLRLRGVEVGNLPLTGPEYGLYDFIIEGVGIRMRSTRTCIANIKLEISSFTIINGTVHRAVAYSKSFLRMSQRDSNLNNEILEIVSETIGGIE